MQNQKDNNQNKNEAPKTEAEEHRDERIEKTGQLTLSDAASGEKIHLLTIIGEIEGHVISPVIRRPRNMSISCHNWQPSKTVKKLAVCWYF